MRVGDWTMSALRDVRDLFFLPCEGYVPLRVRLAREALSLLDRVASEAAKMLCWSQRVVSITCHAVAATDTGNRGEDGGKSSIYWWRHRSGGCECE